MAVYLPRNLVLKRDLSCHRFILSVGIHSSIRIIISVIFVQSYPREDDNTDHNRFTELLAFPSRVLSLPKMSNTVSIAGRQRSTNGTSTAAQPTLHLNIGSSIQPSHDRLVQHAPFASSSLACDRIAGIIIMPWLQPGNCAAKNSALS